MTKNNSSVPDMDYMLELDKVQHHMVTKTKIGKPTSADVSVNDHNKNIRGEILSNNRGEDRLKLLKVEFNYKRERGHSPRKTARAYGIK